MITIPTLKIGYAYASSKRYPKEPVIEVVGESEVNLARFIGVQHFEGHNYNVFRVRNRYYFQLTSR